MTINQGFALAGIIVMIFGLLWNSSVLLGIGIGMFLGSAVVFEAYK